MTIHRSFYKQFTMYSLKMLLFVFLYFSTISLSVQDLSLIAFNNCDQPIDGKGTFEYNLKSDPKRFDLKMHIPSALTDEDTVHLKTQKKVDGVWEDQNEQVANICEYLDAFLQDAYGKFKSAVKPALTEECQMDAGDYELKDFQLGENDVRVPLGMLGEYKIEFTPNSEENPLFCFQVHGNIS